MLCCTYRQGELLPRRGKEQAVEQMCFLEGHSRWAVERSSLTLYSHSGRQQGRGLFWGFVSVALHSRLLRLY